MLQDKSLCALSLITCSLLLSKSWKLKTRGDATDLTKGVSRAVKMSKGQGTFVYLEGVGVLQVCSLERSWKRGIRASKEQLIILPC